MSEAFNAGSIAGKLGLDMSGFDGALLRSTAMMSIFPSHVTNFLANPLLGLIGIAKDVGSALGQMGFDGIKLAGEFEQAEVALGTMLGGADKAKQVLAELSEFAASTPFEMPELVQASKLLIAFGTEQENLIPTLTRVGDVAAGLGIPFRELAEIYGKARVQGTLFMEDINQLAGRGIPIQAELAKQFGVTTDKVKGLVSGGSVTFANLEQAFISLTAEGGKFNDMMAAQSQTLNGLWSSLQDAKNTVLREVGEELIKTFDIKGAIESASEYIANNKDRIIENVRAIVNVAVTAGQAIGPAIGVVATGLMQLIELLDAIIDRSDKLGEKIWNFLPASFAGNVPVAPAGSETPTLVVPPASGPVVPRLPNPFRYEDGSSDGPPPVVPPLPNAADAFSASTLPAMNAAVTESTRLFNRNNEALRVLPEAVRRLDESLEDFRTSTVEPLASAGAGGFGGNPSPAGGSASPAGVGPFNVNVAYDPHAGVSQVVAAFMPQVRAAFDRQQRDTVTQAMAASLAERMRVV